MSYFEQTKSGESRFWSWILVISMTVFAWFFLSMILAIPLTVIASSLDVALIEEFATSQNGGTRDPALQLMGASPIAYALILLTFPAALVGLFVGQKFVHLRTIRSLHTAANKFRFSRAFQGFILTWMVLGIFSIAGNAVGFINVEFVFNGKRFWAFAFVSLLFIPLQSATEEIAFRGYFNQGLTHFLKSKWIAFIITSLFFMALHLSNPEALEGAASGTLPIVMSSYFFFGFAMCLIVWIDDGLETVIGIHAGNNCFAAIIMNYENSVLPTPSIFLTGSDPVKDAISTFIVLAVLVFIFWSWRDGSRQLAL